MTKIFDIHSHILPGLDDGAGDLDESIEMLRLAESQGITELIATPHYSVKWRNACPERIRSLCRQVEDAAYQRLKKEFRIWPGQEILYTEEAFQLLEAGKILTMADSSYVLIEFLPEVPYSYIFRGIQRLVLSGYRPILAHAERYRALRSPGRLEELRSRGAHIQLNFRSAGERWCGETARWCRRMLAEGKADFLGTDMHDTKDRRPDTERTVRLMSRKMDSSSVEAVLRGNAYRILENRRL